MNRPLELGPSRRVVAAIAAVLIVTAAGSAYLGHRLLGSHAATTAASSHGVRNAQAQASAPVPFLGPFAASKDRGIVCGPAVRLMEGALRRTTPPIRKSPAARCVGLATTRQLIRFQTRHHIPPSGIYGARTHAALAHAYSRVQVRDLAYLAERRVKALRAETIVTVAAHAYDHKASMGYCNHGHLSDCSLRVVWPPWPIVPTHLDCSAYVSWVLYQAGVPNPNGAGVGNTTSLWRHGLRVGLGQPLAIGDLVFYASNNSHVAIVVRLHPAMVSSHGQPGLKVVPWDYRFVYGVRRYF
jgi:hypothetical protein